MKPTTRQPLPKRVLCAAMSVVMAVSLVPLPAYAGDAGDAGGVQAGVITAAQAGNLTATSVSEENFHTFYDDEHYGFWICQFAEGLTDEDYYDEGPGPLWKVDRADTLFISANWYSGYVDTSVETVDLERISLYRAEGTLATSPEDPDGSATYSGDDYPTAATFGNAAKRTVVWSAEVDGELAHHRGNDYSDDLVIEKLALAGVPLEAGVYFPVIEACVDGESQVLAYYPIQIDAATAFERTDPRITSPSAPDATAGKPYSFTLGAQTGSTPAGAFTWNIEAGALPDGLALDGATGTISGTPRQAGASTFTVKLTETVDGVERSTTREFTIVVQSDITLGDLSCTTGTFWLTPAGKAIHVSVPISADLKAAGLSQSKATARILQMEYGGLNGKDFPYYTAADMTIGDHELFGAPKINNSANEIMAIEVRVELFDDDGNPVMTTRTESGVDENGNNWSSAWEEQVVITKTLENPDITLGGWAQFPALDFSDQYGSDSGDWPFAEGRVRVWQAGGDAEVAGEPYATTSIEANARTGHALIELPPGDYVFTVEGTIKTYDEETDSWSSSYVDIGGDSDAASAIGSGHPAQYLMSVIPGETTDIDMRFSTTNVNSYRAEILFENGSGGWEADLGDADLSWYVRTGEGDVLVATGPTPSIETTSDPVYVQATPTGDSSFSWSTSQMTLAAAADSTSPARAPVQVKLPRKPHFKVSGSLTTATGWKPAANGQWGAIEIRRPLASGSYTSQNKWVFGDSSGSSAYALDDITPGTVITFTPRIESVCGPVSYTVPDDASSDIAQDLTAPNAKGVISFAGLHLLRADDQATSADNAAADRTVDVALTDGGSVGVDVTRHGTNESVPFYVFADDKLVIGDEEADLASGAQYDVTLNVFDKMAPSPFTPGDNIAVSHTATVTLEGAQAAADIADLTLQSRGNAAIGYSNPARNSVKLLMYDNAGALAAQGYVDSRTNGTVHTPFSAAGSYTLYAVEWDVISKRNAEAYDTSAKLDALVKAYARASGDRESDLMSSIELAIEDNKTVVADELGVPAGTATGSLVDRSASAVTATTSYSDYASIDIYAQLADGVTTDHRWDAYIEIYTNQASTFDAAGGNTNLTSISMNGTTLPMNRWSDESLFMGTSGMADGWLLIDLDKAAAAGASYATFPWRANIVVPRTNFERTTAWAWLVVDGKRSLIGSFDESHEEVTLTAPDRVASSWESFWVHGDTGPGADVSVYLDGMRVASAKADEFGYYTAQIATPRQLDDCDTFTMSAQATWLGRDENTPRSATSPPQDVTYTTSRAAVEKITMFYQEKPGGSYNVIEVYDRGKLSAKYLSYYRAEVDRNAAPGADHAKYYWMATLANPGAARNVQVCIPRSDGEMTLDTTNDLATAEEWIPDVKPKKGLFTVMAAAATIWKGAGGSIVRNAIQAGNAWVTQPTYFTYAPNEAYVVFDDVVTELEKVNNIDTFGAWSKFLGWKNDKITDENLQKYLDGFGGNNQYVNIVESTSDETGLTSLLAATATDYKTFTAGNCDEWLALGTGKTYASEDDPGWLKVHHTVATEDANSSEAKNLIAGAEALYAKAKDKRWNDTSLTYNGQRVGAISTADDIGIASWAYFVQTDGSTAKNSSGNPVLGSAAVEAMFVYDIDGTDGLRQYSLIRANKQTYTRTDWDESTGQKIANTLQIDSAQVFAADPAVIQQEVKVGDLMYQWSAVLTVVQKGYERALEIMDTTAPTSRIKAGSLKAQGEAFARACLRPRQADPNPVATWSGAAPRFNDDAQMSIDEARDMMNFLDDNKGGDLETESAFHADHLGGGIFNNAKWAFGATALQEMSDRVDEVLDAAPDGAAEVAKTGGKMLLKDAFKTRKKTYSVEYHERMEKLYRLAKETEKNGGKVNWNRFPKKMKSWFEYLDEKRQRTKARGYNGKFDPSGYVYEAVPSNRVEGATVALYTFNAAGRNAVMIDSEKFGVESNPQVTGANGSYQWFVPEGYWQVRVTKDGYEPFSTGSSGAYGIGATKSLSVNGSTIEASDYWMPVLPEQVDVNIPLVSKEAPTLDVVGADRKSVTISFSKHMKAHTLSAGMFTVGGKRAAGIEPVDAETAADGSGELLARTFRVRYASDAKLPDGRATASITMADSAHAAQSYAGVPVDERSLKAFDFELPAKAASSIKLADQTLTYTGAALAYGGKVTRSGSSGAVSYTYYSDAACTKPVATANVRNAGTYYVKATLAADASYLAATSPAAKLTVAPKSIAPTVALSTTSFVYNGTVQQPAVTVRNGAAALSASDYTVAFSGECKDVGTYTATVTLKGNYTSAATTPLAFTIYPMPTALSKVKAAKRGFTAKWKKQAAQTSGYQLQYSLKKNFKSGNKTLTVKKSKTVKKKVTKLKAKKVYYVRVRTYKTVGNTKLYSAWSKAKKVKTKK